MNISIAKAQDNVISLAGQWSVRLDSGSVGISEGYYGELAQQKILLPGTLDQAELGEATVGADYGILSRRHKYIGLAWYSREIDIPRSFSGCEVELYLERVMWSSQVWIDGRRGDFQDGLGTPHFHNLGILKPGKHLLSVCVDNSMIYNIGDKGHSYGEYTQVIWNGIIGRIELRAVSDVAVKRLKTWPLASDKTLGLTFDISNKNGRREVDLQYRVTDLSSGRVVKSCSEKVVLKDTLVGHEVSLTMGDSVKIWDEFTPNLYSVEVSVGGKKNGRVSADFGFRDISTSRSKIMVNGRAVFMRGNLDCLHFPLTGYPSCDVEEWERIFKIYKSHGLNHVRFHSWCPPEAAFVAADRLGIYIQAEVLWIDWWMSVVNKERPEMTTKGLPKGLGSNSSADKFVPAELARMVEAYGNHPSFAMLCVGNELGNSDFEVMQRWVDSIKQGDNRRLYSISTARRIMPVDQYMVTHNIPGVGGTYGFNGRGTDYDLEHNYSKATIPILAHELGQYPVYPRWSEIDKYRGVLEARNLMQLKELAVKNGLVERDSVFHRASGALQTLLYKSLLENLFRTGSCAGFSMLSMTDYSGQGEALVGWLDSFWDSKGIVSPSTFKQYSNSVVLLSRFEKYVWESGDAFRAMLQVANYGVGDIEAPLRWQLSDVNGNEIESGEVDCIAREGMLSDVREIAFGLPRVVWGERYIFSLSCGEYRNEWSLWVFEGVDDIDIESGDVLVADRFDSSVEARLARGGKVLLLAGGLGREEATVPLNFTPLFWSNSFFPGQSNKTLGMYINAEHPALAAFTTSFHTDWQWQSLCNGRAFNINAFPAVEAIVEPISDFHISDRLASIFECRVGAGKLMVCSHLLNDTIMEARVLKNSLLRYMNSEAFAPSASLESESLKELFYSIDRAESVLPKGFEGSVLYVMCGGAISDDGSVAWSAKVDKVVKQQKGCDYSVECDDAWRDNHGQAWTGREISVDIKTPNGILGDLYVKLEDWNGQNRQGVVSIEGRESRIDKIPLEGQWIKLFVMREDTNDGCITFKARSTNGSNLMMSQIALVKRE